MHTVPGSLSLTSLLLCTGLACASSPSFQLVAPTAGWFFPAALSGDGSRVIGSMIDPSNSRPEAVYFDWRESASTHHFLSQGRALSCIAASFDGSVIVGSSREGISQPFRWANGVVTILGAPEPGYAGFAADVTADGSRVLAYGYQSPLGQTAAMWSEAGGWNFLPILANAECIDLDGVALSADGSVAVGHTRHCVASDIEIDYEAVSWSPAIAALGWSANVFGTHAQAISADGSTIVGRRSAATGSGYGAPHQYTACRWTALGIQDLAPPTVDRYSSAIDASADGSKIVGYYANHPFLWTESTGVQMLEEIATTTLGLDLQGWALSEVHAISDDGTIILGTATDPAGARSAFILDLGMVCIADFNSDGIVDFMDYADFVAAFAGDQSSADLNHDHALDFFDYLDFVSAFAAGC